MRNSILLLIGCVWMATGYGQSSVYDQPLHDIDNNSVTLSSYTGKKVLFIVLPVQEADTSVQQQLLRFQQQYDSSLVQVVGIVALEEGYDTANQGMLRQMYASNTAAGMILTEAINVRKAAGGNQAALLQWLTNKDANLHYNEDAQEAGQKFFVNELGELFAVMGSRTSLDAPVIERVVSTPVPVKNIIEPEGDTQE